MAANGTAPAQSPVSVSLKELQAGTVPFSALEEAFGETSLGIIIVRDLPPEFVALRRSLLSSASYLANLPSSELEKLENPAAKYLTGWSLGRETLRPGVYDTFKGSYYVNCAPAVTSNGTSTESTDALVKQHPDLAPYTSPNTWPSPETLPGFQPTFESLCNLIIDVAALVARACDSYAAETIDGYRPNCLERYVKTSSTTKARLLHYFPPPASNGNGTHTEKSGDKQNDSKNDDDWCATHLDHGCLTGLTSAMFIDETANPPTVPSGSGSTLPPLDELPKSPSPDAGLYIRSRTNTTVKVSIPRDCLAFQTGEALQIITQGKFRAVPHFVRGPDPAAPGAGNVARNTLAVFTREFPFKIFV
ncbi:MAG: hypothetical protein M4579_006210 [Chaenotheca gracillima]|nr:MAG: hypothetical protein M4579_006210 [Chaenotheca gracillima]